MSRERECDCKEYEIIYYINPENNKKEVSHGVCKNCLRGVCLG